MRPCTCDNLPPIGEPYSEAYCRLCWLWHHDAGYNRAWGGKGLASARTIPCAHLGPETGGRIDCPSCSGRVQLKLRACTRHGACTVARPVEGVACCMGCPDYTPADPFGGPVVRNLLMHVLPLAGNGVWQSVVAEVVRRIELFNGRRVVAIATGQAAPPGASATRADRVRVRGFALDSPDVVRQAFRGAVHEFVEVRNDPNLREVASYEELFERVETTSARQVTLYCHAKGVTRPSNHTAHQWTRLCLETCCDYWPLVERLLRAHPCAAPFVRRIRGWAESRSEWHPSGSFWWFRNREWFRHPDWRTRIDRFWSGIEAVASRFFQIEECAPIFFPFHRPGPGLYDRAFFDREVMPAYESWKAEHAAERREW